VDGVVALLRRPWDTGPLAASVRSPFWLHQDRFTVRGDAPLAPTPVVGLFTPPASSNG